MTRARQEQVDLAATPYYHCISRCVRRAFLCGKDDFSGKNYEHRKDWIVDRIKELASIFSIDVCSYAILSNHFHLIFRVNSDQIDQWDNNEIVRRWGQLFKQSLAASYVAGDKLSEAEKTAISDKVDDWREHLHDISWFMRCLNEWVARKANEEDRCKGRFWEGRFKSQALLDEGALFTCMAYVDLNPIRAGIAKSIASSDYTSVQLRAKEYKQGLKLKNKLPKNRHKTKNISSLASGLLAFVDHEDHQALPNEDRLPMQLEDYLQLVDWTGRVIRHDKKGAIPPHISPILDQLHINEKHWILSVKHFNSRFFTMVGHAQQLQAIANLKSQKWLKGIRGSLALYKPKPDNPIPT